jgi:hypothetical protein
MVRPRSSALGALLDHFGKSCGMEKVVKASEDIRIVRAKKLLILALIGRIYCDISLFRFRLSKAHTIS